MLIVIFEEVSLFIFAAMRKSFCVLWLSSFGQILLVKVAPVLGDLEDGTPAIGESQKAEEWAAMTGASLRFRRLAKRMTIFAESRGVMVRLIRMTAVADVALRDAPLMGNMTDGAVRRRVGRFQM